MILCSRISAPHLSISDFRCWASPAGVEATISAPSTAMRSRTWGSAMTRAVSACSFATTSSGVPLGAKIENQDETSKPGRLSATGANSGATGDRRAVVMPSALIEPARTWLTACVMLSKIRSMRPPIRSCVACAVPR